MIDESVLQVDCQGERLLAVLSLPGAPSPIRGAGIVIVVGGPQVRVGSHRQFVHLARSLASRGWPVLRFDARGMGDSSGTLHDFQALSPDIRVAVDALCARTELNQVVLWGLCDGASASLLYLHDCLDPRVVGLCLVNPWVRSESSLARHVRHYYLQRLLEGDFWRKLMRGEVAASALRGLAVNLRAARRRPAAAQASFQSRMAKAWRDFHGPIQLVLSEQDHTAREFLEYASVEPAWAGLLTRPQVQRHDISGADHTFSLQSAQQALESAVADWLDRAAWQ